MEGLVRGELRLAVVLCRGALQDRISGEVGWQQKSYPPGGDGTHALVWVYSKDSNDTGGSDRGWVDYLQWTPSGGGGGSSTTDWEQITYTYDPSGRRIRKLVSPPGGGDVDGVVTKYLYDGDHCIAEYDGDDTLLRKFIHGPHIDEPRSASLRAGSFCMLASPPLGGIEAAGSYAGTYYYHYDALGSVVALSDDDGETVQVYEYDVYGQPGAADPGHPNPFAFTGRRFDPDTGLYYYRARYYNPTLGRFLQTDPACDGTNLYSYCRNNPIGLVDPSGNRPFPDVSEYWHTFEVMVPIYAISDLTVVSDAGAFDLARSFFEEWTTGMTRHYPDWHVGDAHQDGSAIHIQFFWEGWFPPSERRPDGNPAAPPVPDIRTVYLNTGTKHYDAPATLRSFPVVVIDDVGQLEDRGFHKLMGPTFDWIHTWRRPPWYAPSIYPTQSLTRALGSLDSPFHKCEIELWEYAWEEFHSSEINYFAMGYAMKYLRMPYAVGRAYVWAHKYGINSRVTPGVLLWWEWGYSCSF